MSAVKLFNQFQRSRTSFGKGFPYWRGQSGQTTELSRTGLVKSRVHPEMLKKSLHL